MHGDGISYEARSGGSCKNFAIDMGNAVWLSVSGVTTIPQVGYPGALYIDSGGGEWVPRGYLLTDNGGTYRRWRKHRGGRSYISGKPGRDIDKIRP